MDRIKLTNMNAIDLAKTAFNIGLKLEDTFLITREELIAEILKTYHSSHIKTKYNKYRNKIFNIFHIPTNDAYTIINNTLVLNTGYYHHFKYITLLNEYIIWLSKNDDKLTTDLLDEVELKHNKYYPIKEYVTKEMLQNKSNIKHRIEHNNYYNMTIHYLPNIYDKYMSMKNGRTLMDLPLNIVKKYSNITNVLNTEKIILNSDYYTFTDKQLDSIYDDPLNILTAINNNMSITTNKRSLIEYALTLYDPDAYYAGKSFIELVYSLYSVQKLANKYKVFYIYTIDDYSHLIVGLWNKNHLIQFDSYGIIKVLLFNNKLPLQIIYKTLLYTRIPLMYRYKIFKSMVEFEYGKLNLNSKNISIGTGESFPFTLLIDDSKQSETKQIQLTTNTLDMLNNKYARLLAIRNRYKRIVNDIDNKVFNKSIKQDILPIDYEKYVHANNVIKLRIDQKIKLMYKKSIKHMNSELKQKQIVILTYISKNLISNLLGLFILSHDYDSINTLIYSGMNLNLYSSINTGFIRTILIADSFKMLKYLNKIGMDIDVFTDENHNIINTIFNFKNEYEIVPTFIWLLIEKKIKIPNRYNNGKLIKFNKSKTILLNIINNN